MCLVFASLDMCGVAQHVNDVIESNYFIWLIELDRGVMLISVPLAVCQEAGWPEAGVNVYKWPLQNQAY